MKPFRRDFMKKKRKALGLTLEALGAKIDSPKSYVWELESESEKLKDPSGAKLFKIAKALGCKMEDFYT